jgi:hypothetical protein
MGISEYNLDLEISTGIGLLILFIGTEKSTPHLAELEVLS